MEFNLIATATFGLEAIVKREVEELGYPITETFNGGVLFKGGGEAIKKCNLYLRSADRVLICVNKFKAYSFEELFDNTYSIPWEDFIPNKATFPVVGKSIKSLLHSVPNCQKMVKKAIATRLGEYYKTNWIEETGPLYKIEVTLLKDEVILTIDTTGPGLHKRGYRNLTGYAPLKETLAAALVDLSYYSQDRFLYDPFCGTGTILIEAAMKVLNIPPGLNRSFVCETWENLGTGDFAKIREEGRDSILNEELNIFGSDVDGSQLSLARAHIENAGLEGKIHVQKLDVKEFKSSKKYGIIIANPPYGERMGSAESVQPLYKYMGGFYEEHPTWSCYFLTAYKDFEKVFGQKASRRRKLYNGKIECTYYQYLGPKPPMRKDVDNEGK
ncbi:class I SAM-dependent RNA methyltransferase [endosymbiont 'TC1' of Trimyema compressum]|uniref:THUMP domain-containing class I SAM-dependent RNA methyltransferase n=1 Tax=endosymbiont 'TC1' of Trimyema compressum TaxID=243899 RepID=UPI000ABB3C61